jgi:hypothetical protein
MLCPGIPIAVFDRLPPGESTLTVRPVTGLREVEPRRVVLRSGGPTEVVVRLERE